MSTVDAFQHRPLDLTEPGVRVLDLLPLQADGAIRCRLRHDVLGPSLQFSAVSYEWGSLVSGKHEIYIDDMSFEVPHNLLLFLTALLHIYSIDGYKSLWIDAICIDQLNIEEKNHQVQQMKNIYQMATNVLVWLGPSDDKIDRLFDFLQDLCIPNSAENAARSVAQLTLEQWKHYQDKVFGAGVPVWEACEALSKRTYWSRTWILQEILLAKQPLIFCGGNKVPWQAWAILLDTLDKNPVEFVKIWAPEIWGSPAMSVSREWFALIDEGPRENLIQLTTAFRKSECSILQDKVYGLLGLLSGGSKLIVDYDREIEDLLLDLLEITTSDTTISDVENLLEMFEINNLSSIQMALDCVYTGKCPIAQISGWLKIGATLKGTDAMEDISSRAHSRQLRWCNQLESQQLIWRFKSPSELERWNSGRLEDLQPRFPKPNLLTHAREGKVMKCQCPRCCAKLNTSTVGSRLFKVLSALSYKDTARDLEGYPAALLYRRLSGKETYFATLVNVRETSIMLLFYDPVSVEEIQPARSATGSLARTFNLIAHQHSPLSLESASPLAECRTIQLAKAGRI
ncbi:uncharacterized protein Z519_04760 [Cladophialophora bantiana CBS 173.52]|uniref:Heterokaryon incompatibility domain-containing protein n=1 Tax=Cladophialophora bantiana (strain ATCC 10958 / CBS 173.52 / CDC B-1940 / NIH 8579) TaxID=1442370 RepID=A0A0D2HN18_CLAB1|nr:uncharacterized protein Z519_04760 [Cladophialophora bantiana CBS 173.52]KIW94783.1 hypothetical protein Z519_04760 [Cladophialophora bantiana CBS 173.52]